MLQHILAWFLLINVYGYIIMGVDKKRSIQRRWRISENHLWTVSIFGGAIGIFSGMKRFHHKTQHKSFKWLVPVCMIINMLILFFLAINLS
ncbi:DUF1294 domain-containing protein [Bacillus timonensis]|nr:DUF1294 domain-containing protein [Bacillus timonensis]